MQNSHCLDLEVATTDSAAGEASMVGVFGIGVVFGASNDDEDDGGGGDCVYGLDDDDDADDEEAGFDGPAALGDGGDAGGRSVLVLVIDPYMPALSAIRRENSGHIFLDPFVPRTDARSNATTCGD